MSALETRTDGGPTRGTGTGTGADTGRGRPAPRASVRVLAASIALLGILLASSPFAQWWYAATQERAEVRSYVQAVDETDPAVRDRMLAEADSYNDELAGAALADPFARTASSGEPAHTEDTDRYLSLLSLDTRGTMATISIPALDVVLPVYHGSSDDTLRKGVGHIYGSSLPVGGDGTHSVLVGHSGHGKSRLFNALPKMRAGAVFSVATLGREMHYRVTSAETVDPEDIASLHAEPGRDLVTLVTCTPIGINSHRLLVHAERIAAPDDAASVADAVRTPFPWWAVVDGAAALAWGGYVVWVVRSKPRRDDEAVGPGATDGSATAASPSA